MTTALEVLQELKQQGDEVPDTTPLSRWVRAKYLAKGLRERGSIQVSTISVAGKLRYLRTQGYVIYDYFHPHGGYWQLTSRGRKRLKDAEKEND